MRFTQTLQWCYSSHCCLSDSSGADLARDTWYHKRRRFRLLHSILDLLAAFDTVDHETPVRRLKLTFGLSGNALNLLASYLSGRDYIVRLGADFSEILQMLTGVPQGSAILHSVYSGFDRTHSVSNFTATPLCRWFAVIWQLPNWRHTDGDRSGHSLFEFQ